MRPRGALISQRAYEVRRTTDGTAWVWAPLLCGAGPNHATKADHASYLVQQQHMTMQQRRLTTPAPSAIRLWAIATAALCSMGLQVQGQNSRHGATPSPPLPGQACVYCTPPCAPVRRHSSCGRDSPPSLEPHIIIARRPMELVRHAGLVTCWSAMAFVWAFGHARAQFGT